MPDLHRREIAAMLHRAAAAGTVPQKAQYCETSEDVVFFAADAISTTILTRVLHFSANGTTRLKLLASGGRLVKVISPDRTRTTGTLPSSDNEGLMTSDLEDIVSTIESAFPLPATIGFVAERPAGDTKVPHNGIAGGMILQFCGLSPTYASDMPLIEIFQEGASDLILASQIEGGAPETHVQSAEIPPDIWAWVDAKFASLSALSESHRAANQLIFFGAVLGAPVCVAFWLGDPAGFAMVMAQEAAAEAAQYWSTLPNLPMSAR